MPGAVGGNYSFDIVSAREGGCLLPEIFRPTQNHLRRLDEPAPEALAQDLTRLDGKQHR